MNKQFETREQVDQRALLTGGRRNILQLTRARKATLLGVVLLLLGGGGPHLNTRMKEARWNRHHQEVAGDDPWGVEIDAAPPSRYPGMPAGGARGRGGRGDR
jgi:hypothetical protein